MKRKREPIQEAKLWFDQSVYGETLAVVMSFLCLGPTEEETGSRRLLLDSSI